MTRNAVLQELLNEYAARRSENAREEERRLMKAARLSPALPKELEARRELVFSGMRKVLAGEPLPDMEAAMAAQNEKIRSLLKAADLPEDYLQPIFTCKQCEDTGFVGDNVKDYCPCLKKALNQRLYEEVGLSEKAPQTFETFDLNVFGTEKLPGREYSQRELMKKIEAVCKAYADSFPQTQTRDLLFIGPSGLGKTFLMQAIAHRVLEKGFNVLCVSAYRVIEMAREAHFKNDMSLMAPLMEADLLLVDDLGVEPLMDNITLVYLYNLVNERQTRSRHTIYSTNLTKDELWDRYSERIASRLLDPRQTKVLPFLGQDVRRREVNQ
ncbi:MAG: ATP-binding protein [Clostridia bacterium]|nr:ATP-binding protein [Clostridia bacterium]